MRQLFAPLHRRAIWLTFAIVILLGSVGVALRALSEHTPGRVAEGILLSFGVAFFIAGFVAFITNRAFDFQSQVLSSVERPRRRKIRRAVIRGETRTLPESEQEPARDFAGAYVTSTPSTLSPILLFLPGFLFQAAAQLVRWDGDWSSWIELPEAVLVVVALAAGIPLQLRWLRNAEALSADGVSISPTT